MQQRKLDADSDTFHLEVLAVLVVHESPKKSKRVCTIRERHPKYTMLIHTLKAHSTHWFSQSLSHMFDVVLAL